MNVNELIKMSNVIAIDDGGRNRQKENKGLYM